MKSIFKVALLPSMLATSLFLVACQNSSSPDDEVAATSESPEENDISAAINDPHAFEGDAETHTAETTGEQKMIDKLARYRWTLSEATDNNAQPLVSIMTIRDQVTLIFNEFQSRNNLSYSVGCNTISAAYQLQGSMLTSENSMSTKMSCGELDKAEELLNQLMLGDSQLMLVEGEDAMLTQVTSDASTLVWSGTLTPQAKYNSKGQTIFWSIDSETQPCADNEEDSCLQIKPITYDDQGIKIHEGEMQLFEGKIDGYEHDSDYADVLRLQRYKLDGNALEGSDDSDNDSETEYAYVLDRVIERTVVE